jgi:hypothetical protein
MGVEEERRKARVAEEIAVNAGMGAVALEQRDVFEATALEQLGDASAPRRTSAGGNAGPETLGTRTSERRSARYSPAWRA